MECRQLDSGLIVYLDSSTYPEAVVYKCFYWYTGEFTVDISQSGSQFVVTLTSKETTDFDNLVARLKNDLLDHKLRAIVLEETKSVRELIIAKAFAYYDDEQPAVGDVSDPVGFSVDL